MPYATPPSKTLGDIALYSDWNQYVKANWESLTGLIAYGLTVLSGWSEYTTARGLFILGLVSGGTLATAVGTPLTNQQNITHTHTITYSGWSSTTNDGSFPGRLNISTGAASPAAVEVATAALATGTATAGSIGIPYIQLLCIKKD